MKCTALIMNKRLTTITRETTEKEIHGFKILWHTQNIKK